MLKNIIFSLLIVTAFVQSSDGQACPLSFDMHGLDNSNTHRPDSLFMNFQPAENGKTLIGHMDRELFDSALDKVEEMYKYFLMPAGVKFVIDRRYGTSGSNTVGREGDEWSIILHEKTFQNKKYETYETVLVVACHEIGHHLGETAYYSGAYSWAAAEGQADYYVTTKCLRKVFEDEDNEKWVKEYPLKISKTLVSKCRRQWKREKDVSTCIRSSLSAYQRVVSVYGMAKFETPDKRKVTETKISHPQSQCRLDTFFQGALCLTDHNDDFSKENNSIGACTVKNSRLGSRPRCWYAN